MLTGAIYIENYNKVVVHPLMTNINKRQEAVMILFNLLLKVQKCTPVLQYVVHTYFLKLIFTILVFMLIYRIYEITTERLTTI